MLISLEMLKKVLFIDSNIVQCQPNYWCPYWNEMALINFPEPLDMLYCSTSNPAGYIHIITWIQFNLCAFRPVTEPPVRLQLK